MSMKTFNFTADICGTLCGSIEAESLEDAREKLQDNLRLDGYIEGDKNEPIDTTWDFKAKCHGNCCSFFGQTDDEYGLDVTGEEE